MNTNSALIVPAQSPGGGGAAQAQFHDGLKPLIDIPNGWLWVLWIVIALAVLAAAYLAWRWWRKKAARIAARPLIPPHVRARQMLDEALRLIGEPKPFSTAVSGTIRVYLEERFQFHAPERTTEEFLYELQGTDLLTTEQKGSLGEFLANCDLIKFAKYEPTEQELRGLHAAALKLVNETEPRLVPENIASTSAQPPVQPPSLPPVMAAGK
jgi:hypothetical protein